MFDVDVIVITITACVGVWYEGTDFVLRLKVYGITLVKHKLPCKYCNIHLTIALNPHGILKCCKIVINSAC